MRVCVFVLKRARVAGNWLEIEYRRKWIVAEHEHCCLDVLSTFSFILKHASAQLYNEMLKIAHLMHSSYFHSRRKMTGIIVKLENGKFFVTMFPRLIIFTTFVTTVLTGLIQIWF